MRTTLIVYLHFCKLLKSQWGFVMKCSKYIHDCLGVTLWPHTYRLGKYLSAPVKLCLIIFFLKMHVAFYRTPKIQTPPLMLQTGGRLHMGRYTARVHHYYNLFMAPPSEKREIWGAIIGSPHMYSPQCAPGALHGEHFDDNLPHYTLTFRQWLHALSLLPQLLMAIFKCCLWQSGRK